MTDRPSQPLDVAIAGGGVTGLTLAYLLQKAGLRVTVLERRSRPGGVIRSERLSGFLFDAGPNSTMARSPYVLDLIEALGLNEAVRYAGDRAASRYVLRQGRLCKLPDGPTTFLRTDLLSPRARLRVLGEVFVPRGAATAEESVADFVTRRLGPEFLDYVIDPFVAGIFAGDPAQLNLKAAFPRLYALERDYGGLFRGMLRKRFEKKSGRAAPMPGARLFSFDAGMQTLTDALARRLGPALQTDTPVERIERRGDGFLIETANGEATAARRVILACPAYVTASLIERLDADAAQSLASLPYAPVAVVFYGFKRADVAHPLDGFGCLVPKKERRAILGTLWNSSLFPGRAPGGHVALTTFVGGLRQPDLARLPDDALHRLVREELDAILGLTGAPVVARIRRLKRAIPQYTEGHPAVIEAVERLERRCPGLHVAGNFRGGVSVADCIANAHSLAHTLAPQENP